MSSKPKAFYWWKMEITESIDRALMNSRSQAPPLFAQPIWQMAKCYFHLPLGLTDKR